MIGVIGGAVIGYNFGPYLKSESERQYHPYETKMGGLLWGAILGYFLYDRRR